VGYRPGGAAHNRLVSDIESHYIPAVKHTGVLISFEGIDGSGKSTQAQLLKEYFAEHKVTVVFVREPGGTKAAEVIRDVLLNNKDLPMADFTELMLFLAARADLVDKVIEPALRHGRVVIADRFADSTFAYQAYGRGINLKLVKQLNETATKGVKPDLTFLVDLPEREAARRLKRQKDRMESLGTTFHQSVRLGFRKLAAAEPRRIKVLDGRRPEEEIFSEILRMTLQFLRRSKIELPEQFWR
jgi:dTMP kinase